MVLVSRFFAVIEPSSSESEHENEEAGIFQVKKNKFMESDASESDAESYSQSESSSFGSSSSDYDEEGEEGEQVEEQAAPARKSRFLMVSDDEDDDEGVGRVVKSQKEKASDEIIATISLINDATSNEDWHGANVSLEKLLKLAVKHQRLGLPKDLYDFLSEVDSAFADIDPKKLEKEASKAFNAFRQKARKAQAQYSEEIARAGGEATEATMAAQMPKFAQIRLDQLAAGRSETGKVIELNAENVVRKLQEIVSSRGKKSVDRQDNLRILNKLLELATTEEQKVHILNVQISTEFDIAALSAGFMPYALWSSTLKSIALMLSLLKADAKFASAEASDEPTIVGLPSVSGIRGTFSSYLYRIDDEYTKSLQSLDLHSADYANFLKDEGLLAATLQSSHEFFATFKASDAVCNVLLRCLEHTYYKTRDQLEKTSLSIGQIIDIIKERGSDRLRAKALLCYTYHLALNAEYKAAREIFSQNRFQDVVANFDTTTQILYNRTLVQMALCAFRLGYIKDAYFSLQDVCSSGRPKELLAQGSQYQRSVDRTPEQERAERLQVLPAHLFLNIELIDCVFLTCSMLLEVPQAALHAHRSHFHERKLYQSRHLKRLMDSIDRNLFSGPSENTRESLVLAARNMAKAEWESVCDLVRSIKIWCFMPDFDSSVYPMLVEKIKAASLCTFVFALGASFTSLGLDYLGELFELPRDKIVELVSSMIRESGITATLDESSSFLLWKSDAELSRVQATALHLAEKVQVLVDRNDETSDFFGKSLHFRN
jgi:translation initiation factor 3 subunit C